MSKHLPLPNINYRHDPLLPTIVTVYIAISVTAVFVNKYLTTASEYKFNYSIVMVLFQLVIASLILLVCKRILSRTRLRLPKLESRGWRKVWPCTCLYLTLVLLDPLFLTRVPVTMYNAMHSTSLLFTLAWTLKTNNTVLTKYVCAACLLQSLGLWLTSPLSSLSWLVYPLLISFYAQVTRQTLVAFRNNVGQFLQWHLIVATVAVLAVAVITGELGAAYRSVLFFDEVAFWIQVVVGSILALAIHVLMVMVIKYSSPLSFMVASTAKTSLQAILAWFVFRNALSGLQFTGLLVSLFGAALYSMTSTTKPLNSVYSM